MTIKSNTPAQDKDCWQTPIWLFDALDIEFGFWLDSAASDKNALCAHWLTESDDALNSEWISRGAIWNNPPTAISDRGWKKPLSSAYNSDRR